MTFIGGAWPESKDHAGPRQMACAVLLRDVGPQLCVKWCVGCTYVLGSRCQGNHSFV